MPKYTTLGPMQRTGDEDEYLMDAWVNDRKTIVVHEDKAVKTGLLDHQGRDLYRLPESAGFRWWK